MELIIASVIIITVIIITKAIIKTKAIIIITIAITIIIHFYISNFFHHPPWLFLQNYLNIIFKALNILNYKINPIKLFYLI